MEPKRKPLMNDNTMQESLKKYIQNTDNDPERVERYIHFYRLAESNGVAPFRYARIAEEYTDDYFADTGIPLEEKDWYYERGILTFKTGLDGLTKDNYNDFVSDFDFYNAKNYLKKPQLIKWFDYKLTTYYVLSPFRQCMPRHFFFIENGELIPIDADMQHYGKAEDVLEIIQSGPVALKSCVGGHGKGFYKIEARENDYYINDKISGANDIKELLSTLDNYILTEYAIPHKVFRNACGEGRFAVLRTVTVFDKDDGPQLTAAAIRLGTSTSGIVSDYNGCIYCGVELATGELFKPLIRSGDEEGILIGTPIKTHPDTGAEIEGIVVPNYDQLVRMAKDISSHLPMTPYLVMDIIPTDSGFSILEINSHGQVRFLEPFFPFRKNKYNLRVFQTRDW